MNIVIALILGILGILCLVYFRSLARTSATFMAKRFRECYGQDATERRWDNPNTQFNKYFYRGLVIVLGLFLLIMSFHEFFGTIKLNQ